MGQDYAEEICQAIDEIVSKRIEAISYDKTFTVTIVEDNDASYGKYKVSDGTAEYYAYSTNTNYHSGERVYITVPNGDYTQQKIIVGKYVRADNNNDYNYVKPFSTFVDMTGNLLGGNSDTYKCELIANYPVELNTFDKCIYDREVNGKTETYDYLDDSHYYHGIKIWEADLSNQPLTGYSRLGIKAQFKSYLSQLNCVDGNYGLRLITKFARSTSAGEANLYYQAKEKIQSLVDDMPNALFNTYCEYHGLITDNQITVINTKSDFNALIDKLVTIYRQHYTWLMSHGEELELSKIDNYPSWERWGKIESFLEQLNDLQDAYINTLDMTTAERSSFNDLVLSTDEYMFSVDLKTNKTLADLFLEFLLKRQLIAESFYAIKNLNNVNTSETYYTNITDDITYFNLNKDYIYFIIDAIKPVIQEFQNAVNDFIFNDILTDIATKENKQEAAYAMNLDVEQMIGDPYGLESYTEQEAVFSIRDYGQLMKAELYFFQRIGKIIDKDSDEILNNLSFYDKDGNDISFYTDLGLAGSASQTISLSNLFEKDPYICVGYALEDFDNEHVQLYTLDSMTYSANSGIESSLNDKNVHLRWVHKLEDDTVMVDKDTTFASSDGIQHYPDIRWYRYKLGAPSPDEYAGVSWERINQTEIQYDRHEEEVTTHETMPNIANLKTFYLCFHTSPTTGLAAHEGTYSASFTPEYKVEKTQHIDEPINGTNHYSYTGYWTDECRNYYHLSEELASHAFLGQRTSSMPLYGQSWEDIFLSHFVYHSNQYAITDYYTGDNLPASDVHYGYKGYGCLHAIGFWEKFTMAYRLYWAYPEEFQKLGVDDLFRNGGSNLTTSGWALYQNKNIYKDISYVQNTLFPNGEHNKFTINSTPTTPLRQLFTAFADSFGEWGYVTDDYGMLDFRPVDENVYERLYNATQYLYQKIDDPNYTHTEVIVTETVIVPDSFHYKLIPDITKEQEKLKVIILCLDEIYESNELVFTNESYVPNPVSTDQAQGFYLWCADNTYGNYFIYSMNNLLINDKQSNIVRTLEAHYRDFSTLEGDSDLLTSAERITWKIPYVNTMLVPYGIDIKNKRAYDGFYTDATVTMDDNYVYITREGRSDQNYTIDPTIQYTIAKNNTQTHRNNYIQCVITLNGNQYSTVKEFSFGTMGTSGTDYTLIIDLDDNNLALDADSRKPTLLNATARLYDSEGADVTAAALVEGQWEWFWHPDSCGVDFETGKILLDSGFDRSIRLAAEYNDLDPTTGDYYVSVSDVTASDYINYYYRKEVDAYKYQQAILGLSEYDENLTYYQYNITTMQYEIATDVTNANYEQYYIKVKDGTTYQYTPANTLDTYDSTLTYWKKNSMYQNVSKVNQDNYEDYYIQQDENTYIQATDATHGIYYEITPASKANQDTFRKYYIQSNNVYIQPETYITKQDNQEVIYYEPIQVFDVNELNYTQYYIYNTGYYYELAEEYNPGLTYYDITPMTTGVNSVNYKSYFLKKNEHEYYQPSDDMAYSDSITYYQIRETTNVNASNLKYIRRKLAQYEHPVGEYRADIAYYILDSASAVTEANYKTRVEQGIYVKTNNTYKKVNLETYPNYEIDQNYYFVSSASEVTVDNYSKYYIQENGNYVIPTEYDETKTYYKLTNTVNELINSVQSGSNTASISCVGDISLNNLLILGVRLSNWGNYTLTTYLPIPIREVDKFEYVNLTTDVNKVKNTLEDYEYSVGTYDDLITEYNNRLKNISVNSSTQDIEDAINNTINLAKQTQRTEQFMSNTYKTLKAAASQFAVESKKIIEVPAPESTSAGNYVYTSKKFCEILMKLADESPTIYNNTSGMNLGIWTGSAWSFDCWNLVKSIIWGFSFSKYGALGGGVYCSHGLPDTTGWGIVSMSYDVSTSFTAADLEKMKPGEFLYKNGHAGVFLGKRPGYEGYWAIECTPAGTNNVQWSHVYVGGGRNLGSPWTHHCKLPWINYAITSDNPTGTTIQVIDNSISGYEEALTELEKKVKVLINAENLAELQNAILEINDFLDVGSTLTAYKETSGQILGQEQVQDIEEYYNEILKTEKQFEKLYDKYFNELIDTTEIVLNGNDVTNTRAVAKAHLWGGYAVNLKKVTLSDRAKKYLEQYANKYFATKAELDAYFDDNAASSRKVWLTEHINILESNFKASNILTVAEYTINPDAVIGTAYNDPNDLKQAKELYIDYQSELACLLELKGAYKKFSNVFQLLLNKVAEQITDVAPLDNYINLAESIIGYSSDNDKAAMKQLCSTITNWFIAYETDEINNINAKLKIVTKVKNIYEKLNTAISDEKRYKQLKMSLEDLKRGIHAFYKAKEISKERFTALNNNYSNTLKTVDKKILKLQAQIENYYKKLEEAANDLEDTITIKNKQFSALIKDEITRLTSNRNEIITIMKESATLLDAYDSNNILTYIDRQYGYIVGPTIVIYPASGESYNITTNHNEPYQMYMFPEVETSEGYWKIYNPHFEDPNYIGKFTEAYSDGGLGYFSGIPYSNVLEPAAVYTVSAHQYGVQYVEVNVKDYAVPLLNANNEWEIYILPGWNDKIDKNGNKVLGLRSLLIKYYQPSKSIEEQSVNVKTLRRVAINNSRTVWTQPIYTYQNLYPSGTVNAWNGRQVEMGDNYVLAAFMAAGRKNADNTFSGVMFGDYAQDPKGAEWSLSSQTGVYGFNKGAISYAFKEDGTAFIGPAGKGRIQFDGNKGTIASSGYIGTVGLRKTESFFDGFSEDYLQTRLTDNQCGMMIDLDDSIIDMRGTVEQASVIDDFMVREYGATGSQVLIQTKDPYLKITTAKDGITTGNTILNVGVQNYYLQSDNFKYNEEERRYQGTKIDLATGSLILAGDITWSGLWEDQQVQMLFSSGFANYSYVLDDSIIQRGTAKCNDNIHYTYDNGIYTKVARNTVYQPGVDYYKRLENGPYQFTTPSRPKSDKPSGETIDWWGKVNVDNVAQPKEQDKWAEHGVKQTDAALLLNINTETNHLYPIWHKVQATEQNAIYVKDNYVSFSYDQGATWSEPQKIDGHLTDSNLLASLLNSISVDGIYNNGGSIGIRAAAIRTGILYSREGNLAETDNTWELIRKKVNTAIDLDQGFMDLHDSSKLNFFRLGAGWDPNNEDTSDGLRMGDGAIWIKGNGDIVWGSGNTTADKQRDFNNQRIQVLYHQGIETDTYTVIPENELVNYVGQANTIYKRTINSNGVSTYTTVTIGTNTNVSKTTYYLKSNKKKYTVPTKPTAKSAQSEVWPLKDTTDVVDWHIAYATNDHYASWSYDQGKSWSSPQAINGQASESQIVASLLNTVAADGIYNANGNIGIRASAIRTGLLYSRNVSLNASDNTFAAIAKKAGCVIDLDNGYFSLKNSSNKFFITPSGLNALYGAGTYKVNGQDPASNNNADWVLFSNSNFGVDSTGKLYATGADIQGTIRVADLYIGNDHVTATDVTIPVAFNVDEVMGWVQNGTDDREVTIPVFGTIKNILADTANFVYTGYLISATQFNDSVEIPWTYSNSYRRSLTNEEKEQGWVTINVSASGTATATKYDILGMCREISGDYQSGEVSTTIKVDHYNWERVGYNAYVSQIVKAKIYTDGSYG